MSWNGSGLFLRLYNWATDAAAAIDILASRMDGEDDNFATGINNCLTKDGQNSPTANLPMSTFKHTNVGNAAARDEYAAFGQVQDSSAKYLGETAGTSTVLTVNPTPAIGGYIEGQSFLIKTHIALGDNPTLNINSKGARSLIIGDTPDYIKDGMVALGDYLEITYDGSYFRVTGPNRSFLSLNQMPKTLVDQARKVLVVNEDEDAMVFSQPGFTGWSVYLDVNEDTRSWPGGAGYSAIFDWYGENYDTDSFHDSVSQKNRITIPTGLGGIYLLKAHVREFLVSNGSAYDVQLYFIKNGVDTALHVRKSRYKTGIAMDEYITCQVELDAGDYVQLKFVQNDGGVQGISIPDEAGVAEFTGVLLGALPSG